MYKMIEILLIIGLALSYFIYTAIININYYFAIAILLVLIFLFVYLHSKKSIDKEKLKAYKIIVIPDVLIIIYSFIIIAFSDPSILEIKKFLARALLFITTSFGAVAMYDLYGKKSVKILFYAMLLNYGFYIFTAFTQEGIHNIIVYIQTALKGDSTASSVLEAHEITFSFGLLFLYYYLNKDTRDIKKTIVCSIIFFTGFKRIGIIAVIIVMLLDVCLSKLTKSNNIKRIYTLGGIIFLIASFIWIYMVKVDYFSVISERYNINFMGRIKLYSYVKNEYNISVAFLGKGLGHVNVIGELLNLRTAIHSGVLEMYIDMGMIAYVMYTYNKIVLNSKRILKMKNYNKSNIYFLLMIYIFMLWFTDNVATYLNFIFTTNVIVLNSILNSQDKLEK